MIKVIFRKKILQIQRRGEELEAGRVDLNREEGGEERKINTKEKTKGEGTRSRDGRQLQNINYSIKYILLHVEFLLSNFGLVFCIVWQELPWWLRR